MIGCGEKSMNKNHLNGAEGSLADIVLRLLSNRKQVNEHV